LTEGILIIRGLINQSFAAYSYRQNECEIMQYDCGDTGKDPPN